MILTNKIRYADKQLFAERVQEISDNLGIDADWLMLVMYFESGLNSRAVNRTSGATGLIQFLPSTASGLGVSTERLREMSAVDQLYYVEKYLTPYKNKMKDFVDVYLAVFYPSAIGKSDSYVLGGDNYAKVARDNSIFDTNKDGKITRGEVADYYSNWASKVLGQNQGKDSKKGSFPVALGFFL